MDGTLVVFKNVELIFEMYKKIRTTYFILTVRRSPPSTGGFISSIALTHDQYFLLDRGSGRFQPTVEMILAHLDLYRKNCKTSSSKSREYHLFIC